MPGLAITVPLAFAATVERTRVALADEGFGVLTEIDVAGTMKAKLDVELPPYLILGTCNPPLAHRALVADPSVGLLLPCNVVLRALDDDRTSVEAVDPGVMVGLVGEGGDAAALTDVATEARTRLQAALARIELDDPTVTPS
jgi:uncharacterized protein (DUF302 family)